MPSDQIQWFPGHMARTRRLISENLGSVDAVIDVRDARIPYSSANPEIDRICAGKPRLVVFNKASLADPALSEVWMDRCRSRGLQCLLTDCTEGRGVRRIPEAVASLCADRLERYAGKGMTGRKLRVMVLGIPNVGKSTLINRLAGSSKARTEDRPGVTRELQWIPAADGLYLLDSPGVLWPRISDRTCAENLAITGAIKDAVLDTDEISLILISRLRRYYPSLLAARYRLTEQEVGGELTDAEVYELIARKRGFILRGGEISYDRTSAMLLDEFRGGTVGRITLDRPAGGRTGEADPEDA